MNKTMNVVLWVLLFLFLLPSSLAIASWNSLPGSRLFSTKLFMEQALAFVVPGAQAKGDLQIAYTERRFSEATRMIADKSSTQGLSYLDKQVDVTRAAIASAPDPVVKKQLAQKYITTLQNVSTQLEQQKQVAASTIPQLRVTPVPVVTRVIEQTVVHTTNVYVTNVVVVNSTPTPTPTPRPTVIMTQPPPPPVQQEGTQQNTEITIVAQISSSQEQINQTIEEMQQLSGEDNHRNGQNNNSDNNGRGQGRGR